MIKELTLKREQEPPVIEFAIGDIIKITYINIAYNDNGTINHNFGTSTIFAQCRKENPEGGYKGDMYFNSIFDTYYFGVTPPLSTAEERSDKTDVVFMNYYFTLSEIKKYNLENLLDESQKEFIDSYKNKDKLLVENFIKKGKKHIKFSVKEEIICFNHHYYKEYPNYFNDLEQKKIPLENFTFQLDTVFI